MITKEKNHDLRKLLKPYTNKWVALSRDHRKVIAKGNELKEVISKAQSKDVVFLKVFPVDSFYMPKNI
ncbi:MAG: hypothetical protein COY85_01270 [Candidatus Portnoybacteria bacterium CG_4_10_14_0_8_um_filter_40_50]|uniref:DUF5678 domain-containing protein n=1 Tax=Candidatus Portnoybacteria bacterium CG_4_10_14_0_8_um_filter_40_50 TaxID=1974800 RepID=A0A2M7QS19_9BACT|nr:MAG: hypothetical protein COY85_01270 [Candidatus Portnoybacteria bacterium CG_4_10_14_0_8_um_filter_40_50]